MPHFVPIVSQFLGNRNALAKVMNYKMSELNFKFYTDFAQKYKQEYIIHDFFYLFFFNFQEQSDKKKGKAQKNT